MKRLLLLLLLAGSLLNHVDAQTKPWYDRQWKTIDSLTDKAGRPATALKRTDTVYAAARRQGNEPQLLRAIYYRGILRSQNREDNAALSLRELEGETAGLRGAGAAVAHALKAELYYNYVLRNLWSLRDRTTVASDTSTDLRTWSLARLLQSIDRELDAALGAKTLLQQVPTDTWAPLLRRGNTPWLRPTLYDLVAHRALDIYANSNLNEARPDRDYALTAPWVFAPAPVFIRSTPDSGQHPILKQLRLQQELMRFHSSRNNPALLELTDIDRLLFAYAEFDGPEKDSLFTRALRARIAAEKPAQPDAAARYELASWYRERAGSYKPGKDSTWRYASLEALRLLQPVLRDSTRHPYYWAQSVNLEREIRSAELDLRVERVTLPGQPFRFLLLWRNLPRAYLRIVALNDTADLDLNDDEDWQRIFSMPAVASWEQALPVTGDAQRHSAEGKAPALTPGRYLLISSSSAGFRTDESNVSAVPFHVSNLAYLQQQDGFFVLNRTTGRPVAGARLRLYEYAYNSLRGRYERTLQGAYTSNADGGTRVSFPVGSYSRYLVELSSGNDRLFLQDDPTSYFAPRRNTNRTVRKPVVHFFTDRGIYRPGQTVYLKGIVLNENGSTELLRGGSAQVQLLDPNRKEQGKLTVKTNEYGSFKAEFTLPADGLTGSFVVNSPEWEGVASFSVEEYKRPKFEVRFDTMRASYRVGDTITVNGHALAYAGNSLSGAKVRYRVIRTPQIPYYYRYWYPTATPVEITQGETATDNSGRFSLRFAARPDPEFDSASNTVFSYKVLVDVTDLNGESHSGNETINAGYTSLLLEVRLPERLPADSFRALPVQLTNANGEPQRGRIEA
ncbi:MAG: hypothetical protein EOO12_08495, partial [Chitinophagaceae bacterium]